MDYKIFLKGGIDLNVDKGKAFSTEVINRKGRGKNQRKVFLDRKGI